MNNLESNIWGKKKFSDLLKEIYDNQKKKKLKFLHLLVN
jgi:predicted CopG family antitoxin